MKLLRRTGSHVGREIGFGVAQTAQLQELVKAETVGLGFIKSFGHTRLPIVIGTRPFWGTAAPLAPMVSVSETATGPPIVGDADALHVVDELPPDSPDIGNLRIGSDPDTVVDDTAQMLDELAIYMRADLRPIRLDRNLDVGIRCNGWAYPGDETCRRIR